AAALTVSTIVGSGVHRSDPLADLAGVPVVQAAPARDDGQDAADSGVLWWADHEEGDLSDWSADDCGGQFSNGAASTEYSRASLHGNGGLRLWVWNADNRKSHGARAFRWCEPQQYRALYYSAWYYIPFPVRVDGWWQIME